MSYGQGELKSHFSQLSYSKGMLVTDPLPAPGQEFWAG
jgi:hypothetical protein